MKKIAGQVLNDPQNSCGYNLAELMSFGGDISSEL